LWIRKTNDVLVKKMLTSDNGSKTFPPFLRRTMVLVKFRTDCWYTSCWMFEIEENLFYCIVKTIFYAM
jgi:hypothetical protein